MGRSSNTRDERERTEGLACGIIVPSSPWIRSPLTTVTTTTVRSLSGLDLFTGAEPARLIGKGRKKRGREVEEEAIPHASLFQWLYTNILWLGGYWAIGLPLPLVLSYKQPGNERGRKKRGLGREEVPSLAGGGAAGREDEKKRLWEGRRPYSSMVVWNTQHSGL